MWLGITQSPIRIFRIIFQTQSDALNAVKGIVIDMKKFEYTITDPEGLHARPAGFLVKEALKYQSYITILNNGKSADAKKIFSIMALSAKFGDKITVKTEGNDEDEASLSIQNFFEFNL